MAERNMFGADYSYTFEPMNTVDNFSSLSDSSYYNTNRQNTDLLNNGSNRIHSSMANFCTSLLNDNAISSGSTSVNENKQMKIRNALSKAGSDGHNELPDPNKTMSAVMIKSEINDEVCQEAIQERKGLMSENSRNISSDDKKKLEDSSDGVGTIENRNIANKDTVEENVEQLEDNSDSDASTIVEEPISEKELNKSKRKKSTPIKLKKPNVVLTDEDLTCKECGKRVQSVRALEKHMNLHTGKYTCQICKKVCNSIYSLNGHLKIHEGFQGDQQCKVCDKVFYDKSSLNKHTLSVHMGITNFQCEYCSMSFFAKKTYDEHVRVHTGERPFKCELCPKTYKRKADLTHHIRLHKGEVSHTCEKCGDGFRRVSELKRHMQKHNESPVSAKVSIPAHICKWCGIRFSTGRALSAHLQTHVEKTVGNALWKPASSDHFTQEKQRLVDQIVQDLGSGFTEEYGYNAIYNATNPLSNSANAFNNSGNPLNNSAGAPNNFNGLCSLPSLHFQSLQATDLSRRNNEQSNTNIYHAIPINNLDVSNNIYPPVPNTVNPPVVNTIENTKVTAKATPANIPSRMAANDTDEIEVTKQEKIATDNAAKQNADENTKDIEVNATQVKQEVVENVSENHSVDFDDGNVSDNVIDDVVDDYVDDGDNAGENDDYGGETDTEDEYKPETKTKGNSDFVPDIVVKTEPHDSFDDKSDEEDIEPPKKMKKTNIAIKKAANSRKNRKQASPKKRVKGVKVKEEVKIDDDCDDNSDGNSSEVAESDEKSKNKKGRKGKKRTSEDLFCKQCEKAYKSLPAIRKHLNIHKGTFTCGTCEKSFACQSSLDSHVRIHSENRVKEAKCNVCFKHFYDTSSLNKHQRTVHMDYRPFPCPTCDRRFSDNKTLTEHIRVHTGERPFTCEMCGTSFKRFSELNFHIRRVHTDEVKYHCETCGKGFLRPFQLKTHIYEHHNTENPFRCSICRKMFPTKAMLADHKQTHAKSLRHMCDQCGHAFCSRAKLNKHLRNKLGCMKKAYFIDGKYICKYCQSEFLSITERAKHVAAEHKDESSRRQFACKVCGKTFRRSPALNIHMKIHLQIRDFKCEQCDAAFVQRHHLTQHMRTHTGEKPYQCEICSRRFAQSATLYSHMKHH